MQIRARGDAFATGIDNWLISTFWSQLSPVALDKLGWKFYFLFIAFDIVVTLPVVYFFKDTKLVLLEDIDLLFGERALGTLPDNLHKSGSSLAQPEPSAAEKVDEEGRGRKIDEI